MLDSISFVKLVGKIQPSNGTKFCYNYLNESLEIAISSAHEHPPAWQVWSVGLFMVIIISFSAVCGILLFPLLSPSLYDRTLTYFVAVGVGTLSGSAVFNLIPEAFDTQICMPFFLPKAGMVIIGIYLFFAVDKIIIIALNFKKRSIVIPNTAMNNIDKNSKKGDVLEQTNSMIVSAEKGVKTPASLTPIGGYQHEHIAPIAWLVIFGDGLHNFIDGLSIGAAFNDNLWEGISISVAVLCEELPHELGDCAILINSGMTLKKALIYNLLSASTCIAGFIIGVLAGKLSQHFDKYIFALAAGMFLYISLVGMLSEMNEKVEKLLKTNVREALKTIVLQVLGLSTGLIIMFIFAEYGSLIKF